MTTTKISYVYLLSDVILIILSFFMGNLWLINTQVAFICSMFIVFASFFSYKSMIEKRINNGEIGDDRDSLDEIYDKYELFDEEEQLSQDLSVEEFKEVYRKENEKLSGIKRSFSNVLKSWSGALSVFRLFSYGFLFISMLYLIRKEIFDPIAFLVGIGFVPLASLFTSFFIRDVN